MKINKGKIEILIFPIIIDQLFIDLKETANNQNSFNNQIKECTNNPVKFNFGQGEINSNLFQIQDPNNKSWISENQIQFNKIQRENVLSVDISNQRGKKVTSSRPSTSNPYHHPNRTAGVGNPWFQVRKSITGMKMNQQSNNQRMQVVYKDNQWEFEGNSYFFKRRPRNSNGTSNRSFVSDRMNNKMTIDDKNRELRNDSQIVPSNAYQNNISEDSSKFATKIEARSVSRQK